MAPKGGKGKPSRRNRSMSQGLGKDGKCDTRTTVPVLLVASGVASVDVDFATLLADFSGSGRTFQLRSFAVEFPPAQSGGATAVCEPTHCQLQLGSNTLLPLRVVSPPVRYDNVKGVTLRSTAFSDESRVAVLATSLNVALQLRVQGSPSSGVQTLPVVVVATWAILPDLL
jgi:hypothetical protein